jgi:hypothetical protein
MYFKKNLHNDAINSLIELGNKNGFVSSNEVNSILPSFLLSSEQLPKVLEILKNKNIEYLNGSKNEITFQKYKKKSHNQAILKVIDIAQNNGFITSNQIKDVLPQFLLAPDQLNPILDLLKKNNLHVFSNPIDKNDLYILDVEIVSGPSLNPQKVRWKGDMQIITTNHGKYIDTLPNDQYRNETPGYDWSKHIGGEPLRDFRKSSSDADFPWIKKKVSKSKSPIQKKPEIIEKDIDEIRALILKDESSTCEFKESAVWGPGNDDKARIDMGKKQILKALAGFSNSRKGGVLLIGVKDKNKKITGLEKDFKHRQSKDKWLQILIGNIKSTFGEDFSPTWLNQYFVSHHDKEVYVIEVSPNSDPIFLKDKEEDTFYVRDGNLTKPLKGKSQARYIMKRFPNMK